MQASSNLERIADHAHRIAQIASQNGFLLPVELKGELSRMDSLLCSLIEDSVNYLVQTNSVKANELIDRIREIKSRIGGLSDSSRNKDGSENLARLILAGSMERMLDYIMNISELTINLSHAMSSNERAA
jgi:phosphate uptake regulator